MWPFVMSANQKMRPGMMSDWSYFQRAIKVTPNASQTRSKAPGEVGPRDTRTAYPLFAAQGFGAMLLAADGREYLDCFGANAAIPLGYNYGPVTSAVYAALVEGSLLSLPSVREGEVSETFLRLCAPWAGQVRWVKSGSEALSAAVRLARIATGRDEIVVMDSSYHGWHDWTYARHTAEHPFAISDVLANGVPKALAPTLKVVPYGSMDFSYVTSRTAAVVVEPHRWQATDPAWFRALRHATRQHGALMVMDEMVYGLRWALGGSIEYHRWHGGDVPPPDLACFGKALGNGVPVACVCGRTDVMVAAGPYVSGTHGGETLGLAAAGAVLATYEDQHIIDRLWENGLRTWTAFSETPHPPAARLEGTAVHWRLTLPDADWLDRALAWLARAGLLVHRASNNASVAMSPHQAKSVGWALAHATDETQEAP